MVKYFLNILLILNCSLAFGQLTKYVPPNNNWDIYPETNISYPNGKEDLKEILCLQSLLAENRIDEMFKMLDKFGYVNLPGLENCFKKYSTKNTENEIHPVLFIRNSVSDIFYENYLEVLFPLNDGDGASKIKNSFQQYRQMWNIVYTLFPIGNCYGYLKLMKVDPPFEWLDRYTARFYTQEIGEVIFKVSNFYKLLPGFNKTDGFKDIIFQGPGKAIWTHIIMEKAEVKNVFQSEGEYGFPRLEFYSRITDPGKTFKPESKEPFNIDIFMSLENFNDRIWGDF